MNPTTTNSRVVRTVSPFMLGYKPKPVETDNRLRIAAYARVSTDRDEQEFSFERQKEHFTQVISARSAEWKMVGIYADEGITGTKADKRPDFKRMVQDCRDGKIDKILVKSISRFARNTVDTLNTIRELRDMGIGVIFESENFDTLTPGGEVLLTILAAIAEQESRTMSMSIKWAYQRKFQRGDVVLHTAQQLGYRRVGMDENKQLIYEIVEEEAKIVRRIYDEFLEGVSITDICRNLEADGITTKRGKKHWHPGSVLGILQNEKYTGNAILGKTFKRDVLSKRIKSDGIENPVYYVENTHPAIIDVLTFERAKAEIQRRKEAPSTAVGSSRYTSKYPFSGLLECAECGSKLRRQIWTTGTRKKIPCWGCSNRIVNGREKCDSHHIKESVLEATYLAALNELIRNASEVTDAVKKSVAKVLDQDSPEQIETIDAKIDEIQANTLKANRAKRRFEITEEEYDRRIKEYEDQQLNLVAERKRLQENQGKYAAVYAWIKALEETALDGNAITSIDATTLKLLVERFIVKKDGIEVRFGCGVTIFKKYVV